MDRDELEDEVQELRDRVDDLAASVETLQEKEQSRPDIDWDGPNPAELAFTAAETGNTVKPYSAIGARAKQRELDELLERVCALEDGEADVVVRSENDGDTLPIEASIAQRLNGTGNLSANEERATLVFPKFGSQASSWNGKMKLDSDDVRAILDEQTDCAKEDWNYNTIKRVMKQTAKLTSQADDPEDRVADADENLFTLENGEKRLELVAERDDWQEFTADRKQEV